MAFRNYFRGYLTYSERYRKIKSAGLLSGYLLTINGVDVTFNGSELLIV